MDTKSKDHLVCSLQQGSTSLPYVSEFVHYYETLANRSADNYRKRVVVNIWFIPLLIWKSNLSHITMYQHSVSLCYSM